MDMKKSGDFMRRLRKEKGLTQEQLAEILGVAGRTVSRWETASNMPDLSILIQIANFFGVEIEEILDGERRSDNTENKNNETLSKVADYDKAKKEKKLKITQTAFLITILAGTLILLIQFMIFGDIRFIIGETLILLIGGITATAMTVHNGLWNTNSGNKKTVLKDFTVSIVMSAIFAFAVFVFIYRANGDIRKSIIFSACFFALMALIGFLFLRILYALNKKRK